MTKTTASATTTTIQIPWYTLNLLHYFCVYIENPVLVFIQRKMYKRTEWQPGIREMDMGRWDDAACFSRSCERFHSRF